MSVLTGITFEWHWLTGFTSNLKETRFKKNASYGETTLEYTYGRKTSVIPVQYKCPMCTVYRNGGNFVAVTFLICLQRCVCRFLEDLLKTKRGCVANFTLQSFFRIFIT